MIEGNVNPFTSFLGPLTQGIGSIASSLFSINAQKEENQKNRDFALEMWNRQNEYNSPVNQRKLLEAGGYNPYSLSNQGLTGQSQTPLSPQNSPLPQFHNPTDGIANLLQNGLQIQSNVELQKTKQLESITDTMLKVYKDLGQKGLEDFSDKLAPVLQGLNFEDSPYMRMFNEQVKKLISDRYNVDMDSLNKEIHLNLGKKYGEQQIRANLEKLDYEISEIVGRLGTMNVQNEALLKKTAAEVMVAAAQAFELKKVGEKYEADTKTANELRQWVVKTAKHNAELKEVDSYFSNARKESSSDLVGFMTSKEGRETLTKGIRRDMREKADVLIRTFDKLFGEYVKVSSSGSAGSSGFNQSYYGTESSNTSYGW